MKNIIPLIVAVVLGLVAVFAVSRTIAGKDDTREQKVEVVMASRMLDEGDTVSEGSSIRLPLPSLRCQSSMSSGTTAT